MSAWAPLIRYPSAKPSRKPRRKRATGGNIGHKHGFHVRCTACNARRTLNQPPEWYAPGRIPKCNTCGGKTYTRDRYRDRGELTRAKCNCSAVPFTHRKGSRSVSDKGPYGAWECVHWTPF